jgi:class 3 adenylate cyclase
LAVLLALRVPENISTRRLAWSLLGGSLAAGYIFFVTTHEQYRAMIGWTPASPVRLVCDAVAYTAGTLSPLLLARFFMGYPRVLRPEDWEADALRWRKQAREAMQAPGNWRRWLYPARLRSILATESTRRKSWLHAGTDSEQAEMEARLFRVANSRLAIAALVAWALASALSGWLSALPSNAGASAASPLSLANIFLAALWIWLPILTWDIASKSLRIYSHSASPDDRRKVDWIKATLVVGGVLVIGANIVGMTTGVLSLKWLGNQGIFLPGQLILIAPFSVSFELLMLAFVISLALSIFYRGAIDPRLAARKITVFGVIGMLLACVFVLIERTIALKIVAYFNLSPNTGAMIAFAGVAATVAPIKTHAGKAVNSFVGRFLPLDSMIVGERKVMVVALSDLSGYTLLSSTDEKQALLLAALLQRQAAKLTQTHGGRIVKSMGDAVMLAFDDASSAVKVLTALHRDFVPAAEQFGLVTLQVHSGAHLGELTVARDGDLYGQTVNIAARIQGSAKPGQIVVSKAVATADGGATFRELGPQQFKNVPDPITCYELVPAAGLPATAISPSGAPGT